MTATAYLKETKNQDIKVLQNKGGELVDSLEALMETRRRIYELNNKMLAMCKNDADLKWFKNRGLLNFYNHGA